MPDLTGLALRNAMSTLNNFGLEYKVVGRGRVTSQSIRPGSRLSPGDVVLLKCEIEKSANGVNLN
jgi:beta-lactam-binding protein with PASTA domain